MIFPLKDHKKYFKKEVKVPGVLTPLCCGVVSAGVPKLIQLESLSMKLRK